MIVSNVYEYKDKLYIVTNVTIRSGESAMRDTYHEVDKIELSCIDKDEKGRTGKKIYLDPEVFYHCPNVGGTVLKTGEEE